MPDLATGRAVSGAGRARGIGSAAGLALGLVLLALAVPARAQTMYKWVDEKGVTHFSEHPPPDERSERKASKVTPKVIAPANPSAYDPNAWKAREAEARKRQIERGTAEKAEARGNEQRQVACNRARGRLSMLQNTQVIYRDNPDGTRTFMEDKQREAEMQRARDAIREHCD